MRITLAVLVLLVLAPSAIADCTHVSTSCPTVADWRIEGHAGGFTVTTTLLQRFATHADWARLFACDTCGDDGFWTMSLALRPHGSSGFYAPIDPRSATVTDSTFRIDV